LTVTGEQLKSFGWLTLPSGDLIDDTSAYHVCALKVGEHVVYFALNPDPLGRKPYSKSGWVPVNGSFWYKGLPETLSSIQRLCNGAVRALAFNMSLGSGPQILVPDVNRFAPDESLTDIFPGRVWQGTNNSNSAMPLVQFQNIDMRVVELMGVFDRFAKLADDYSGVPAYAYGDDRGSNSSRTSSGLSMLMTAAARGIKRVVLSVDKNVFRHMITRIYDWDLANLDDPQFQGDAEVVATGAVAIMVKEQMAERRTTFLAQTNNPTDQRIMGAEGRGVLLRESAKTLELAGQKIVQDVEELRRMEASDKKAAESAQQAEQQVEQGKIQLEQQKVALDKVRIEGDLEIKRGLLEIKRMEVEIKRMEAGNKAQIADAKTRETDLKAAEQGKPPADDVDKMIAELGLDAQPEEQLQEQMSEPIANESGLGAPGVDAMAGPEVPGAGEMDGGEPAGGFGGY